MFKALTKFGFSAGAITGTICASENVLAESTDLASTLQKPRITLNSISKFEEIEVYARERGCYFVFVAEWRKNKTYTADEFVRLEEEKKKEPNKKTTDWKTSAWEGANKHKNSCKQGTTVALSYKGGNFNIQFS